MINEKQKEDCGKYGILGDLMAEEPIFKELDKKHKGGEPLTKGEQRALGVVRGMQWVGQIMEDQDNSPMSQEECEEVKGYLYGQYDASKIVECDSEGYPDKVTTKAGKTYTYEEYSHFLGWEE